MNGSPARWTSPSGTIPSRRWNPLCSASSIRHRLSAMRLWSRYCSVLCSRNRFRSLKRSFQPVLPHFESSSYLITIISRINWDNIAYFTGFEMSNRKIIFIYLISKLTVFELGEVGKSSNAFSYNNILKIVSENLWEMFVYVWECTWFSH